MDEKESVAKESTVTNESRRNFIKGTATAAAVAGGRRKKLSINH